MSSGANWYKVKESGMFHGSKACFWAAKVMFSILLSFF
jgi:hypothetical protein